MRTSTNLKFMIPELDDQAAITIVGDALEALDDAAGGAVPKSGLAEVDVAATQATKRENLVSGETLGAMIGKVMKWFADIKDAAFTQVANNDSTTDSGYVADARIVKTHGDEIDALKVNAFLTEHELTAQVTKIDDTTITTTSDAATVTTTIGDTKIIEEIKPAEGNYKYTKTTTIDGDTITETYTKEVK